MVAENLNDFFSNVITDLNLARFIDPLINIEDVRDPVLKVKMKLLNHQNIKTIINRFPNNRFSFNKTSKSDIRKEINLNSTKASQDSDIPTKLIKQNIDIFTDVLHSAFSSCLENVIFSSILKIADVTPVFTEDNSNY